MKLDDLTLDLEQHIDIKATPEKAFAAVLHRLGKGNTRPDGQSLEMLLEPKAGGRWYRDLGDNNGHLWAHVQAIKRPTLLEFTGPLFASYPFVSNVQYRLTEKDGATTIAFRHTALGFIQEDHRKGVNQGWASILERVRKAAEAR